MDFFESKGRLAWKLEVFSLSPSRERLREPSAELLVAPSRLCRWILSSLKEQKKNPLAPKERDTRIWRKFMLRRVIVGPPTPPPPLPLLPPVPPHQCINLWSRCLTPRPRSDNTFRMFLYTKVIWRVMRTRLLKTRKRKGSADSAHVHRQSAYELARDIAAKQSLRCLLREKNICLAPRPHYSSWSMGLGHVVRARQFVSERYPNVLTDYVNFL